MFYACILSLSQMQIFDFIFRNILFVFKYLCSSPIVLTSGILTMQTIDNYIFDKYELYSNVNVSWTQQYSLQDSYLLIFSVHKRCTFRVDIGISFINDTTTKFLERTFSFVGFLTD